MPPVPLPRRMWAAGHFDVVCPLVLGRSASRRTVVRSIEPKSGKSGALVFVTLDHELSQQGRVCIREEQNLVYREIPGAPARCLRVKPLPRMPTSAASCIRTRCCCSGTPH
jgi:3-methylfumaryl-CoA hydratase